MTENKKKITALACSPSKGFNSDSMLDAFLEGVREVGGVEVEKIYLIDQNLPYYTFFNRVPDPAKEPEFVKLVGQITECDLLVIATPTFNFGVPATLKNLLDRLSFKALNPKKINLLGQPTGMLNNLRAFHLVSCGTPRWLQLLLWPLFPGFWLRLVFWYFGAKTSGVIYGAGLNANKLAKNDAGLMVKCKNAGKKMAKRLLARS